MNIVCGFAHLLIYMYCPWIASLRKARRELPNTHRAFLLVVEVPKVKDGYARTSVLNPIPPILGILFIWFSNLPVFGVAFTMQPALGILFR